MPDGLIPVVLSVSARPFRVHEHLTTVTFATHPEDDAGVLLPGHQPPLMWEITLPELLELASQSTDYEAIMDAWRAGEKVGQIRLRIAQDYDSFTMTFVSQNDFTSIHVLSLSQPTWAVVIRSSTSYSVVLINSTTHEVLGGDDAAHDDLDATMSPLWDVTRDMQDLRGAVSALAGGPRLVYADQTKARCKNNRKAGWVGVLAGVVVGVLAVPTGGGSLAAAAAFAAIGAMGGAAAAVVDNTAAQCEEDAKKEEEKEKPKEEEKPPA